MDYSSEVALMPSNCRFTPMPSPSPPLPYPLVLVTLNRFLSAEESSKCRPARDGNATPKCAHRNEVLGREFTLLVLPNRNI
jgi:hypothetical protein